MIKILLWLRKDPILTVRILLIVLGSFFTISNLLDCIYIDAPIEDYFLHVGILGFLTLVVLIFDHKYVVCAVLMITGFLMIYDADNTESITGGIMLLAWTIRISNNIVFTFIVCFSTALAVIANHTFRGQTPVDSVNVVFAYWGLLLIDYILSNIKALRK